MACFSNKSAWLPCCAKLQMPRKIIIYRLWSVKFGWLLYVAASSICVLYFFSEQNKGGKQIFRKISNVWNLFSFESICSVFKTFSFFQYFRELFLHTKGRVVLEWEVGTGI